MATGSLKRYTAPMKSFPTLLFVAACLLGGAANAQWQWKDKSGQTVFSDTAPPPDVPAASIIKRPGGAPRTASTALPPAKAASAAGPLAAASASEPTAPKLAGVDKDLQEKKARAEAAEEAKLKAEEKRVAKLKSETCDRAKADMALLDSGVRIAVPNAKGEREILDDAGRAAEVKRVRAVQDASCK